MNTFFGFHFHETPLNLHEILFFQILYLSLVHDATLKKKNKGRPFIHFFLPKIILKCVSFLLFAPRPFLLIIIGCRLPVSNLLIWNRVVEVKLRAAGFSPSITYNAYSVRTNAVT